MSAEIIVIPLWGKIALASVAKKSLILAAGYFYGFPRLYRRSQKLVRRLTNEPATRRDAHGYVRAAFRLPARLLHLRPRVQASPAMQYAAVLPRRLLPLAGGRGEANRPAQRLRPSDVYRRLRTSFASSELLQRQSEHFAASRAKLTSLREHYAGSSSLQTMVESRAARAAEMWRKTKLRPYNLIPAVQ